MTATGSSRTIIVGVALAIGLVCFAEGLLRGAEPALRLHASAVGPAGSEGAWTIDLLRWSSEGERAPLVSALSPPPTAPPVPATVAGTEGRGAAGGRAGRAGRGGREGRGATPQSPLVRLASAVKAAPTIGFIWGGVTGYSIKYAWRSAPAAGSERIVLVADRRLVIGAPVPSASAPLAADVELTLIELRVDARGVGEGKTSQTTNIAVDATAHTLGLDGYQAAPVLLKVRR